MPPKTIVTIGLAPDQIDAIKHRLNEAASTTHRIMAEPDLAQARTKSLANLAVTCVVLNLEQPQSIQAVKELRLNNYQLPILGWMQTFNSELYLQCIHAGMQDALTVDNLESGEATLKIAASIARLECQQGENTDRGYLNQLLEKTADAIYFKDTNGRFLRISKSLVGLFGCQSEQDIIGKTDFEFQSEENARQAYLDEQAVMRSGEDLTGLIEHKTLKCGSQVWVSTRRAVLRNAKDEVIGTMGISRDVTEAYQDKQPETAQPK